VSIKQAVCVRKSWIISAPVLEITPSEEPIAGTDGCAALGCDLLCNLLLRRTARKMIIPTTTPKIITEKRFINVKV
jgi:hypothetical protein